MTGHIPEEQLSAWLDRELDAGDAARVDEHLQACDTCRQAAREMSEIGNIYRAAGELELPPFLWAKIASALDRRPAASLAGARAPWFSLALDRLRIPVAAAASLTIAAAGFLLARLAMESHYQKKTLSEIERARIAVTASLREESYNPFIRPVSADREANPFSRDKLDPGFNPFRPVPGAR